MSAMPGISLTARCGGRNKHDRYGFSKRLAGATGLEPATSGVTGRHSNQLSYAPAGGRRRLGAVSALS